MIAPIVVQINGMEPEIQALSDSQIRERCQALRKRAMEGEHLDVLLPETFALTREISRRTLGMRHFDVQLIGGGVLHQGRI